MTDETADDHWPDDYIFPRTKYDPESNKFIVEFGHEDNPEMKRRIFVRGVREDRYRPITSLEPERSQEGLVVDCDSSHASFLTMELSDDRTGANWRHLVKFDIEEETTLQRL